MKNGNDNSDFHGNRGDLVKVYWNDIARHTNAEPKDAKVLPCWTIGIVQAAGRNRVRLRHSGYEDGSGDFTAIPRKTITDAEILIRARERPV